MKLPKITNITEIRRAPKKVFDLVSKTKQPTIVVRKSKAVAVILDPEVYESLFNDPEAAELLQDSIELEEAIQTSSGKFIDAREFAKRVLED